MPARSRDSSPRAGSHHRSSVSEQPTGPAHASRRGLRSHAGAGESPQGTITGGAQRWPTPAAELTAGTEAAPIIAADESPGWWHRRALPGYVAARARRYGRGLSRARYPLNRDVALKILPESFAAIPSGSRGSSARRRCSASLNHPHIAISTASKTPAARCGAGRDGAGGGRDLAERIARGPLPSTRRCRSRGRSPKRSRPRTSRASSIATSSPRTSR